VAFVCLYGKGGCGGAVPLLEKWRFTYMNTNEREAFFVPLVVTA